MSAGHRGRDVTLWHAFDRFRIERDVHEPRGFHAHRSAGGILATTSVMKVRTGAVDVVVTGAGLRVARGRARERREDQREHQRASPSRPHHDPTPRTPRSPPRPSLERTQLWWGLHAVYFVERDET